jgi:hypothetical protein
MDHSFTYIFAIVLFFIPWTVIYYFRKDLRRRMWISGLFMIPVTLMEYWCLQDYWNPPGYYLFSFISYENILFFFVVTGINATTYDFIFATKNIKEEKRRVNYMYFYVVGFILSLFVFTDYFGFNSILVISTCSIIFSMSMILIRRDLLRPAATSGVVILLIFILIYSLLFNKIYPEYWHHYWLLEDTNLGVTLLGNIPATELYWAFSWGCFSGIAYDFASGSNKIPRRG